MNASAPAIAIVGLACRYPDADTPQALWEMALAQRRAFRRLPACRLNLADYAEAEAGADGTCAGEAAVLAGWHFDRERFRVPAATVRATDPAHWLALTVAADALADAGCSDGAGLPRASTGVVLGNTLTGESSRAGLLRLRWPYARRTVAAALAANRELAAAGSKRRRKAQRPRDLPHELLQEADKARIIEPAQRNLLQAEEERTGVHPQVKEHAAVPPAAEKKAPP